MKTTRSLNRLIGMAGVAVLSLAAQHGPAVAPLLPPPAQTYVDSAGLTLERAVEAALERNAGLLAVRQRVREAQGQFVQSGLRPNPGIDVSVASGRLVNSPGDHELAIGYSHTLELGSKRERRLDASRLGIDLARVEIADRERQLRSEVKTRFGEALAAVRNLETAERLADLTRQSYRVAEARTRQGEGTPLEEGLLKVEVNRIDSDRLLFGNQVDRAVLDLKTLAGIDDDGELKLSGTLSGVTIDLPLARAVQRALEERPDLHGARIQEQLGQAELRLARTEAIPDLVATGRYARSASGFDQFGLAGPGGAAVPIRKSDNQITAGVSITLPSRNRNQGNIQSAAARGDAALLRRRYLEQAVRREVEGAHARYDTAQRALRIFDEGVLRPSQENLRILRAAYDLGELRILDVINEQRRLVETQRAYTDLLREAWLAAVDLERAVGAPLF